MPKDFGRFCPRPNPSARPSPCWDPRSTGPPECCSFWRVMRPVRGLCSSERYPSMSGSAILSRQLEHVSTLPTHCLPMSVARCSKPRCGSMNSSAQRLMSSVCAAPTCRAASEAAPPQSGRHSRQSGGRKQPGVDKGIPQTTSLVVRDWQQGLSNMGMLHDTEHHQAFLQARSIVGNGRGKHHVRESLHPTAELAGSLVFLGFRQLDELDLL